jgi:hypothetical protein
MCSTYSPRRHIEEVLASIEEVLASIEEVLASIEEVLASTDSHSARAVRAAVATSSHAADSDLAVEVDESHLLRFLRLSISLFAPMKIRVTAITKTMKARAAGPNCPPTRDATRTIGETTAARPSTR